MLKKIIVIVLFVSCLLVMSISVFGATGYSSGSTKRMNSFNGKESAQSTITVSSYDKNAQTSTIELNITVSYGSSPFYIIVVDPNGNEYERLVSSSAKLTISDFSGYLANGKWKVSIRTKETKNVVSTATARLKVNYIY